MRFHQKLATALIFSIVILTLSMFASFIPCETAPVIPHPEYTWKFCSQNPDSANLLGIQKKYFGYTSSLTESYIITLILSFILALLLLTLLMPKSK
jgi:hypothetical protein